MNEWDQKPALPQYVNESLENDLIKYFLHGLVFAIFLPVFSILLELMIFSPLSFDVYSSFLGLIAILVLLLPLFFGYLNGELARRLWGYNPKRSVTTWFGQGFLIFMMLPLFGSFYYLVLTFITFSILMGNPAIILLLIIFIALDAIASGYVGKHVAVEFEGAREGAEELASVSDRHIVCPHCGSRFMRKKTDMNFDGLISCPHCGGTVLGQPDGPGPTDSFDSFNQ
jgi:predicted RNA-binding Zn-ribbon protein involved in translation (DUF1610 family)